MAFDTLHAELAKAAAADKVTMGDRASGLMTKALGLGVVGILAAVVLGLMVGDKMDRFFHSWVWNFAFYLSISLGALFFVVLQHLVGARWSIVVRRIAETLSATLPLMFVLSTVIWVPMLFGSTELYLWSDPEVMANDHLLHAKQGWLNTTLLGGFPMRIILYFAIWIAMARFFFKRSVQQDESGDAGISGKMRAVSGPSMIVFAITISLGAFDILMSLEPHWFSTIFGVYYFAGSAIAIFSMLILIPMFLQAGGMLRKSVTVEHYHDVGKLLFAFVFFWAYIGFSQFMLIWMANLPEETGWFHIRMNMSTEGGFGWGWMSLFLIIFHFMIPFVCLMSRWTKRLALPLGGGRKVPLLALFAVYMLAVHWLDMYWLSMPSYGLKDRALPTLPFHPMDVALLVGMGGLFVAFWARAAGKVNLIPTKDPYLGESVAFENQ